MQIHCPKCNQALADNDINVVRDIACCRQCDKVFELSSFMQANASEPIDRNAAPWGTWYREEFKGFAVGATTLHLVAIFLVPFACHWSWGVFWGQYFLPFAQGKLDLFGSIFGIPFILGSLLLITAALMTICGKVVVQIRDSVGVVFIGVGPFGWRRYFDPLQITAVRIEPYMQLMTIILDGPHKLRFGILLTRARLDFIARVLRYELINGRQSHPISSISVLDWPQMKVLCPNCNQIFVGGDFNVIKDIARCRQCKRECELSPLVHANTLRPVDQNDSPRGTWYRKKLNGFIVGATTRSPVAIFIVPFMCFWSGFLLFDLYDMIIRWDKIIIHGGGDKSFLLLAMIPFVLVAMIFDYLALMTVCGKVVVRVQDSKGVVFTGVGPIGWRLRFDPLQITTVRIIPPLSAKNREVIVLDGPRKLRFGSMLSEARQDFIANVLRHELVKGNRLHGSVG